MKPSSAMSWGRSWLSWKFCFAEDLMAGGSVGSIWMARDGHTGTCWSPPPGEQVGGNETNILTPSLGLRGSVWFYLPLVPWGGHSLTILVVWDLCGTEPDPVCSLVLPEQAQPSSVDPSLSLLCRRVLNICQIQGKSPHARSPTCVIHPSPCSDRNPSMIKLRCMHSFTWITYLFPWDRCSLKVEATKGPGTFSKTRR